MKLKMYFFKSWFYIITTLLLAIIASCSPKTDHETKTQRVQKPTVDNEKIPTFEEVQKPIVDNEKEPTFKGELKKQDLSKYYDDEEFIEFFIEPVQPPAFDFSIDCSDKSLAELRCLRNEMFARHGYLFNDAVLRGHFNQYNWYQPIYWDSPFKVELNQKEQWLVDKILRLEKKHLKRNYVARDKHTIANAKNIVNSIQFNEIPELLFARLKESGFAIVEAKHEQLFHVYDKNKYDCIPSYVTTDLYLQLLHMHYSNFMKNLERGELFQKYQDLVSYLYNESYKLATGEYFSKLLVKSSNFTTIFYAIALSLLTGETPEVPLNQKEFLTTELSKINRHAEIGSQYLNDKLFDYTQLKPRGHYTHEESLKRYFTAVKWLSTAPFIISDDNGLAAAIISGYLLKSSGANNYQEIGEVLNFITGEPDNLSLANLIDLLKSDYNEYTLYQLLTPEKLTEIREKLIIVDPEKIVPRGVSKIGDKEIIKKKLFFMAGRYTFDAEILQRLVHVRAPEPKRPFPKGLDIFAALGNPTAEDILLNIFNENDKWPAFTDSLSLLKKKFSSGVPKYHNAYSLRMNILHSLFNTTKQSPYFMHLPEWNYRTLTTALAGWTHIKHENILYTKQPIAAQCGQGGGPPPPKMVGYVEPNSAFWQNCLKLISKTSQTLVKNKLEDDQLRHFHNKLTDIAEFCLSVSNKELNGEKISQDEYDRIVWIGGEVEKLTLTIMDADDFTSGDPERQIGLVSDVYTNNNICLEEAVGYANEIYIVVEIKGLLYLTRGAVLSYYEFTQPSSNRLTDRKWQEMLKNEENPKPPEWTKKITIPMKLLKTKPTYSYLIGGRC